MIIYWLICLLMGYGAALIDVPEMPREMIVELGDINVAAILPIHHYSYTKPCGGKIRNIGAMQHIRAITQAIEMINNNTEILPGVRLGYIILDDCGSDTTALAHVIQSLSPRMNDNAALLFYDVFGIVGPFHSSGCLLVGRYLQLIQTPLVSPTATNDALSDRDKYEYFFRVVPADKYQAKAMVELITHFNWSYISTINSEGVYGRNGIQQVHEFAELNGVCIAYSKEIKFHSSDDVNDEIVENLLRYDNSRVIVMFINEAEGRGILHAFKRADIKKQFVFIFSDSFNQDHHVKELEEISHGAFAIDLYTRNQPKEILDDFVHGHLYGDSNNPFYTEFWQTYYNCDNKKLEECALSMNQSFALDTYVPLIIDSVFTLAHAAHNLLQNRCNSSLSNCTLKNNLLPFIQNVSFNGTSEHIKFNLDGDILARYRFKHFRMKHGGLYGFDYVGRWDMDEDKVQIDYDMLQWPGDEDNVASVCSLPCEPGQYVVYTDVVCCWECHNCHVTEIISANTSTCQACDELYWPDEPTKSMCQLIEPSYIQITHIAVLPIFIISLIGAVLAITADGFFIHFRHNRLIKATSKELSHLMLFGLLFSYLTVILMLMFPTKAVCLVQYFGFNLAFTLTNAPLLTKVNRIHRLFAKAGQNGVQRPPFTSSRASVTIAGFLILVQILITSVTAFLQQSSAVLRMPVKSEKYVELFCDTPLIGFMIPLSYNLLLILICTLLGFKTRSLPDNFNDSKYIFLCSCATVFLWLVLLPTYFAVFYAQHKVILLCIALLLNGAVFLLTLFIPKIYAVFWLNEEQMNITKVTGVAPATLTTRVTFVQQGN